MFLPSQKNGLLQAIKEFGMRPQDFKHVEPNKNSIRLIHKATDFYFLVEAKPAQNNGTNNGELRLFTHSTPKQGKLVLVTAEQTTHGPIDDWNTVLHILGQWLLWLQKEADQPDLWAEMEQTPLIFAEPEYISNEQFTPAEIKLLEARVPEVEQQIINLDLSPGAEAAITAIVQQVPAKAKRLTKKELADTLIGSLVKEGIKWTLTTEHVSFIWHACQHFFTLLLP